MLPAGDMSLHSSFPWLFPSCSGSEVCALLPGPSTNKRFSGKLIDLARGICQMA